MRPRLKDVAERAGVATNTASTILNRRPNSWASKETEARVFKAAEDLGYTPSRAALGLRLGSFKTVGLVIPDLHNPVYTTFADLLDQRMSSHGYDMILEHSRTDMENEKHCLNSILERQIDAVTYFASDFDSHVEYLKKAEKCSKKVVAMTGPSTEPFPFDAVEMDFSSGIIEAVEHLLELGHKRFAFLCALAKGQKTGDRPELYNKILKDRGIPEDQISFIPCLHDTTSAREAFGAFLDSTSEETRPTALIAMNDISAIAAIRAAFDRGLRVPKHLSVIGVDNIPLGECLRRSLTTIAQPLEALADATAEILMQRLEGKETDSPPISKRFKAKLIIKETTAAPIN
ncbi:LacI family DNA-binding transcriptional regulator [Coraliomargarita sp. W4R53]